MILICLSLLLLFGCDDHIKVYFQQAVKGRSAARLEGVFYISSESFDPDSGYATVSFHRVEGKQFLITTESKEYGKELEVDTLFQGEIVRRGNDYFMNVPVKDHPGYWHINSFRWEGDSVYNLAEAITGSQKDVFLGKENFKSFRMEGGKTEKDTLYFIQNRMRETIRAFRQLHDEEKEDVLHLTPINQEKLDFLRTQKPPKEELVLVYPNPFSDHLYLKSLQEEALHIRVLNMSGQLVKEAWLDAPLKSLELEGLVPGMYIFDIRNKSGSLHQSLKMSKR